MRLIPLALAGLLLTSACGSTVQGNLSSNGISGVPDQGLGLPAATAPAAGGLTQGLPGTTGVGAPGQPHGNGSAPVAPSVPGQVVALPTTPVGVTGGTITVGIAYSANAAAANAAFGGQGITTGSEPSDARAVIDSLNKRGGLLGRKVVPLFKERDAQSTVPVANQAQQECSFFTDDHKVFAVLLGNGPVDWAEKPCLAKAGVPTITSHIVSLDDGTAGASLHVDVAGMSERTMVTALLGSISRQSWLSPWSFATGAPGTTKAKVGLVHYDLPAVNRAVKDVLLPGMRRLGSPVDPSDVFAISVPQATSDDAAAEAALQNAVLRLRSDGVDHLLVVDNGGAMTLLLANDLFAQRYLPRLAGTSSNGFQALLTGNNIQPSVLHGLVGTGWQPVIDLPFSDVGASPERVSCLKLLRAAGQTFSDANAEAVALGYCDKLLFLAAVVEGAGALTTSAYLRAVDALGSFRTARGLGSVFRSGQHDGGNVARDFVFDGGCGCVAYRGSARSVA